MGKKVLYVILGMIVAMIVIAECFSNSYLQTQTDNIEKKISQKVEKVLDK